MTKKGKPISTVRRLYNRAAPTIRRYRIGTIVILLASLLYFAPLLTRLDSYTEGGDSMFNAWTLARNHNCLKGDCESYSNGNIYFPNKDTMLYSEAQLSTGLLTFPLHFINENPIFSYNVWKIIATFLSGWFMYLLAKKIRNDNELFSVVSGLVFAFAPFKMSALGHLQNLSIFYLPLIVLLIISYIQKQKSRYVFGLLLSLILLFYASWYQMVFVLVAIGVLLLAALLLKLTTPKNILILGTVAVVAVLTTLPLAKEYIRFSRENGAGFTIGAQTSYSSSVADYVIPQNGTIIGKIYDRVMPDQARRIPYNPDSISYHGMSLYVIAFTVLLLLFRQRKTSPDSSQLYKWGYIWFAIGFVGLLFSLGPLLKLGGAYIYATLDSGIGLSVPLPYILLDFALPQIQFIRAVGRWSALFLFALCVLFLYLPRVIDKSPLLKHKKKLITYCAITALFIELAPLHFHYMSDRPHNFNNEIPAVYTFIKNSEVDDILVLYADQDYPNPILIFARTETVLWAGYHNKNIFNGYSGYTPPDYEKEFADFQDLRADDVAKMRAKNLKHVLIDKQLSTTNTDLPQTAKELLSSVVYEDYRYVLLKI